MLLQVRFTLQNLDMSRNAMLFCLDFVLMPTLHYFMFPNHFQYLLYPIPEIPRTNL